MTTVAEITIEMLDDLFEDDHPCDTLDGETGEDCETPAEYRIGYHCGNCGHEALVFLCHFHLEELRAGNVLCAQCHAVPERFVIV